MSKKAILAVAALAATAPIAPEGDSPPDTPATSLDDMERVEGKPADPAEFISKIAELNTALDEERRRVVELEAALIEARSELRDQRARFDAAWIKRFDAEVASLSPERVIPAASPPPVGPRRFRAVGSIRCHLRGAPITIEDGAAIPEGVELSTLPREAFEEV